MDRRFGTLLALLSAALFGASTPVAKELLEDVHPSLLAGIFYLGAASFLFVPMMRRRRTTGASPWPKDRRNLRNLGGAILFGGILGPVLLLLGLQQAQAASVSMLLNLETVATACLAFVFFREHIGKWTWLGNAGVLAAGVLLSIEGGRPGIVAGLLVAAGAFCWGLDNNFTALIDGITPVESTFWKGLVAGTVNVTIGLFLAEATPGPSWIGAWVVGGLAYGVSIALYITAAQMLGATRSQMIFASSPAFGVVLAVLWLGEPFTWWQGLAGGLLVLSTVLMFAERHAHRHTHETVTHTHSHRHDDDHHGHRHNDLAAEHRHTHEHHHARETHAHPHWPDLHHRHAHDD